MESSHSAGTLTMLPWWGLGAAEHVSRAPGPFRLSAVGSDGGPVVRTSMTCDPLQATTNAAITQCNGSANGGGSNVTCTATGTMASALGVTIDQCNKGLPRNKAPHR